MNGSGTPNRSRLTPNPPGAHDDSSYNAALKGASLAFQKSTPKKVLTPAPSSRPASRNIDNGALIAAASAASASREHSRTVSRQTTGGSIQGGNGSLEIEQGTTSQSSVHSLQLPSQRGLGTSSHLGIVNKSTIADPRSPSFIAATLAASRSGSPVRHQTAQSQSTPQPIRRQRKHSVSANNSAASSVTSFDLETDTTSIPSTNTLISMFEKRDDNTDPVKKANAKLDSRKPLRAKITSRTLSPSKAMSPIVKNELSPSRLASSAAWERASSPSSSVVGIVKENPRQPQNVVAEIKARPPAPPPARTKNKVQASTQPSTLESKGKPRALTPPPKSIGRTDTVILSPQPRRTSKQIILNDIRQQDSLPRGETSSPPRPKPQPQGSVHTATESSRPEDDPRRISTSSNDTFVSASSAPSPHPSSPQRGRPRLSTPDTVRPTRPPPSRTISTTVSVGRPPALPPRLSRSTSTLPLESLTDAIMAGSLASSRITPSKTPPTKPPSRKQTPHMRQTLRQPPSKSDDEEKRRKPRGKLGGKNKHSHHEGMRKRWREEITERERKRYEGVWASNRGLLLVTPDGSRASSTNGLSQALVQTVGGNDMDQGVANVVVRDLWARSRLPVDELAEVWDLVDRRGRGYLDRAEFVVGMWLVDQRLRGRKIPRKVTESVWGSARGVRVAEVGGKELEKNKKFKR
ncbi:hypothetical protein F4781DRAFT_407216 [Annulohypoxylon bovei var. microspora]|nr:hypothetical protein F4781DRAFT_407216 [Annulohypoxylon bovei var. microspora]